MTSDRCSAAPHLEVRIAVSVANETCWRLFMSGFKKVIYLLEVLCIFLSFFLHHQTFHSSYEFISILHILFNISRSDLVLIFTFANILRTFISQKVFLRKSDNPYTYFNCTPKPPTNTTMRLSLVLLALSTLAAAGPLPLVSSATLEARVASSVSEVSKAYQQG